MNGAIVEQYRYLLNRFESERERDTALDALLSVSDCVNKAQTPEAFIYQTMKNRVANMYRDAARLKEPTKMEPVTEKEFITTKPDHKHRKKVKARGSFEDFYNVWLMDHNTTDSIRNRSAAESEWDILKTVPAQIQEVSSVVPLYTHDDGDEFTYEDTLASTDPNPEEQLLLDEEAQLLLNVSGVDDWELRKFVKNWLPSNPESNNHIKTAYGVALVALVAKFPNWNTMYLPTDIDWLCEQAGVTVDSLLNVPPAIAARQLRKLQQVRK